MTEAKCGEILKYPFKLQRPDRRTAYDSRVYHSSVESTTTQLLKVLPAAPEEAGSLFRALFCRIHVRDLGIGLAFWRRGIS